MPGVKSSTADQLRRSRRVVPTATVELIPHIADHPVVSRRPFDGEHRVAHPLARHQIGDAHGGLFVSTKFACNVKLLCITNCNAALFVKTTSGRPVPPVQLVNMKPVPGVAVML